MVRHKKWSFLFLILSAFVLLLLVVFISLNSGASFNDINAMAASSDTSGFTATFIDVGQGDSSLITCDGHSMLIDGGTSDQSQKLYSILKSQNINQLDYVVCTHPHADHAGGLPGALAYAKVGAAFAPVTTYDNSSFNKYVKAVEKQGKSIIVPEVGSMYPLGNAIITVLGPTDVEPSMDPNDISLVLRIDYGQNSFLFSGDAEQEEQQLLMWNEYDLLNVDVLKAAHHGSSNGASYAFIKAVSPSVTVISCGVGNSYGHPHAEALELLQQYNSALYRTDLQGDIVVSSDGTNISVAVSKNELAAVWTPGVGETASDTTTRQTPVVEDNSATTQTDSGVTYIVNINTKKFHLPTCPSVKKMKESNKMTFTGSREDLINQGYDPCQNCNP
ncbi:ComEC/Rec2 family competence protein [Butyrivibrio fibrisolvens]|uniref:MBL fold hydrolase n=1 Tax=Butyrivibrio fibrisolvens TaxID=831 RepID=A0A317G0Q7_BUTFI|nr:ComEC/Rec2 family competence protein [Butyrivibrio fibrisolvens]PWT27039.1 MBL fold hydrolase [Butyrivibrio fibrisolvens]